MRSLNTSILIVFVLSTLLPVAVAAQDDKLYRNNPFAPSPASITDAVKSPIKPEYIETIASAFLKEQVISKNPVSTTKAIEISAVESNVSWTKIYRIGVGDLLTIDVENFSRDYAVRDDGSIDFPLIAENFLVAGLTVEALKDNLEKWIKLYVKPRIAVTVRDRASHSVLVTGMVDAPGSHQIQRDAVPLFVIRAVVSVSPKATEVKVTRGQGKSVEMYLLAEVSNDNILIFPGDLVEFTGKAQE